MLLPYKTKNPPEHVPFVTISLIVINMLIYVLTSLNSSLLRIDEGPLQQFAVTHSNVSLWRLTSAMFLHGNLEHIIGNMLFLWLFGAAAEGRLRPLKFLILYFLAGWTGGLLSDLVQGASNPDIPSLGASVAIMGVAGAYLYLFPHSTICVFYWFRMGVAEWRAWWVVSLYIGMDVLFGVLFRNADGVGHFAHIGGFGAGLLVALALRARRDSEERSAAQRIMADVKDYSVLGLSELEAMLQQPTENLELVLAYCERAIAGTPEQQQRCLGYLQTYGSRLIMQADPARVAALLLRLPVGPTPIPLPLYLRLGSRLESAANTPAVSIYRRIYDTAPTSKDSEMALYRTAQVMVSAFGNRDFARQTYYELLRLFPYGDLAPDAKRGLEALGG